MSSLRSKKILELVQAQDQPANQTDNEHSSKPDCSANNVTMLSDVTNKPENQRYLDVRECFSQLESSSSRENLSVLPTDLGNQQHYTGEVDCSVENEPPIDFENSDVDCSDDQDPTYNLPKE
ncbi:Protein CBR-GLY-12 [Operophtera brumata]|uniref:Protein CBR-GLY-12 n=1 Tax=Operophtera brumata TaxID=104452 RepID=A0A0L7LCN6_OPEBR|nr:Protein CBR-GLY-12 [Operophtera brumata]KOB73145.1 Protein CBR-GLY-12 [Operophtera brumata]